MEAIVSEVLQAVDDYVPDVLAFDDADAPLAFALSAIRRMADLVDAELTLALAERHSVTRTLGRPVIELWLYANDLLLDGEAALDRLFAEDAGHQSRLEHGRQMVWDHLESKRAGGIDPRSELRPQGKVGPQHRGALATGALPQGIPRLGRRDRGGPIPAAEPDGLERGHSCLGRPPLPLHGADRWKFPNPESSPQRARHHSVSRNRLGA